MDKYQKALDNILFYCGNANYDKYLNPKVFEELKIIQELIDKHKKVKEDLLFLKEQGIEMLESPNGRKFLALEITNMPSEINYRKELFEKLMNDIINNIINGE